MTIYNILKCLSRINVSYNNNNNNNNNRNNNNNNSNNNNTNNSNNNNTQKLDFFQKNFSATVSAEF